MAKFYLINTVSLGTTKYFPGDLIDDAQHPKAAIETAGGVMWPEAEASIATAAALALQKRKAGANESELEAIMNAAVSKLQKSEDADHDNAQDARVRAMQVVIALADLTAKGAVASGTFDSATFPAGARLLGVEGNVTTKLQNAGDTDTTTYAAGTDGAGKSAIGIAAGTTADAGIAGGALGVGRAVGGEKLRVTVSSSVNLNTLSAGGMTVTALYSVPAVA